MRNHGASQRDPQMDYVSLACDVLRYMESVGLQRSPVALVGHSLGAKTAMTFACLFPHLVERLVSLDASPVDRNNLPHLNESSQTMIKEAMSLGSLQGMPLEAAIQKIKTKIRDPVLQTALLFNLNPDGSFQVNLSAIHNN